VTVPPGWYKDPVEPTTQRYWDGEGWLGEAIPAEATPPSGPPRLAGAPGGRSGRPGSVHPSAYPGPAAQTPPTAGSTTTAAPTAGASPGAGSTAAPGAVPSPGAVTPSGATPTRPSAGAVGQAGPWPATGGVPATYAVADPAAPHALVLASPGARFIARLVDILAVVVLNVLANGWLAVRYWQLVSPTMREAVRRSMTGESTDGLTLPEQSSWLLLAIALVGLAVWFAYEVPATANGGQTMGKWLLGVKVMRMETAERLGLGRSWRRWRTMATPTLFWCCGIGFVLQAVDCLFVAIDRPLRQALHDKSAQTVVVRVARRSGLPGRSKSPRPSPRGDRREPSDPR
jgi:uncharacterized RDD family membrane protein YckC